MKFLNTLKSAFATFKKSRENAISVYNNFGDYRTFFYDIVDGNEINFRTGIMGKVVASNFSEFMAFLGCSAEDICRINTIDEFTNDNTVKFSAYSWASEIY